MRPTARRFVLLIGVFCTGTAWLSACHYDWELPADSADAAIDASSNPTSDGGSIDSGVDVPLVTSGDCDSSSACDAGFVCHFTDLLCGRGVAGKCTSVESLNGGAACPNAFDGGPSAGGAVACGCDAKPRSPLCQVYQSGTDLSVEGGCPLSMGQQRCGYLICTTATSFCVFHEQSGSYSCEAWGACSTKDCACAKSIACTNGACGAISGGSFGGVTVDCP